MNECDGDQIRSVMGTSTSNTELVSIRVSAIRLPVLLEMAEPSNMLLRRTNSSSCRANSSLSSSMCPV